MRLTDMLLIYVAHILNVFVLVAVLSGLIADSPNMASAYGSDSAARRILGSVYFAIMLASIASLILLATRGASKEILLFSASLFGLQIIYKLTTAITVGTSNPVVLSNLLICIPLALGLYAALAKTA
jgi:hypothetical protein